MGLAVGLVALMRAFNLDLPRTGIVFAPRTVSSRSLVGTLITLVASIVPAIKATRIPPIAAVREGGLVDEAALAEDVRRLADRDRARGSGRSSYALLGHGVGAARGSSGSCSACSGSFIGIAMLAPRLVRPLAHLVGAPGGGDRRRRRAGSRARTRPATRPARPRLRRR